MIPFVKAHACGNDFLVVRTEAVEEQDRRAVALRLCARNTGIGADGVEFLEWTGERSARVRLFNADGSIAEISGNGTRCVAAWMAREKQAMAGDLFSIETDAGIRECRIVEARQPLFEISTGMGLPVAATSSVGMANGVPMRGVVVSMGNPHFVIFVDDVDFSTAGLAWEAVGREICFHPDFPQQTNVEFVRVMDTNTIELRIFERGVGPTTSSGTGTCAAAAAAIAFRGADPDLRVIAPGGAQRVSWAGGVAEMTLTGPAELIAAGEAF